MKRIWEKYGQLIKYFTFGIFTTISSWATFFIVTEIGFRAFDIDETKAAEYFALVFVAEILQWVVGVIVAFFTNKNLVFNSKDVKGKQALRQFLMFTGSRFITLWVDMALTALTIWLLHYAVNYVPFKFIIEFTPEVWSKIVASVFVVIANYLVSKYLIFRKIRKNNN